MVFMINQVIVLSQNNNVMLKKMSFRPPYQTMAVFAYSLARANESMLDQRNQYKSDVLLLSLNQLHVLHEQDIFDNIF